MREMLSRIEKRFLFTKKETWHMFLTALVGAFAVTFRKWGTTSFNLYEGLTNLILAIIGLFVIFLVHFSAQKIMALSMGYDTEFKLWVNGIMISLFVTFFTYGFFPLFFTGSLFFVWVEKLRVGKYRGGVMHNDVGMIAIAGPLSNLALVTIAAPIYMATQSQFIYSFIVLNLLVAIFSMLPIPTFEKIRQFRGGTTGLHLFISSRVGYILAFTSIVVFSILIMLFNIFSYIIALLAGIIAYILYINKIGND